MSPQPAKIDPDLSTLTVHVSKPKAAAARRLVELGLNVLLIRDDEGDSERFVFSKRLAVDRRAGNSFLNGIMDKTLFTAAIYLREHFRLPVLIVEGPINYEHRGFDPQSVRGALSSMVLEYGVNVLTTADLEDTVQLLVMMARQEQIGIPEISLVPKRTAKTLPDMQRRVAEMLPGCGRVMARELLQHFGSFERIVRASADELRQVPGIGAKKARDMCEVLATEYEAVDTERQIEDAIEADPSLLFEQPVELVDRQHFIFDDRGDRHIVDMLFADRRAGEVILVELKRGRLEPWHREQLKRYLAHADESAVIRRHLDGGFAMRGILASVDPGKLAPRHKDITVVTVDEKRVIAILTELRRKRLSQRRR